MDTPSRYEREIVELHQFFQDWFNGTLEETNLEFARFEGALGPGFVIVGPDGLARAREEILRIVRESHASAEGASPIRLWIENVEVRHAVGDVTVATYEEWQEREGEPARGRLSTVVFQTEPSGPNGLSWLHVHETWLPEHD